MSTIRLVAPGSQLFVIANEESIKNGNQLIAAGVVEDAPELVGTKEEILLYVHEHEGAPPRVCIQTLTMMRRRDTIGFNINGSGWKTPGHEDNALFDLPFSCPGQSTIIPDFNPGLREPLGVASGANSTAMTEFWAAVPLYQEELELKLREGTEALLEAFDSHGITDRIDPHRTNVAFCDDSLQSGRRGRLLH